MLLHFDVDRRVIDEGVLHLVHDDCLVLARETTHGSLVIEVLGTRVDYNSGDRLGLIVHSQLAYLNLLHTPLAFGVIVKDLHLLGVSE